MDKLSLARALTSTLVANDVVADTIMQQAKQMGVNPYELRNSDGSYPIAQVLNTRATVLAAMVALRLS